MVATEVQTSSGRVGVGSKEVTLGISPFKLFKDNTKFGHPIPKT